MKELQIAGTYAAVADATDKADLAVGRQRSHDKLIEMAGDRRRGPVEWRQIPARHGIDLLTELEAKSYRTEGDVAGYEDLKAYLRQHPRGALIIATAPVDDEGAA